MRLLVIVILIASSGWSAYWFVGKSIRQAAINNWFNEKSENGWDVQNTLHLRGFPNRFDAFAAEKIILALRKKNNTENKYDIALDLKEVFSNKLNFKNYDPNGTMPNEFEILTLDASADFDEPLNQKSFEQKLYNISNFKINKTELEWGSFKLKAVGNLSLDPDGYPNGNITIRATNWERVFDLVLENRVSNKESKNAIRTLFKLFGNISQNNQELEIPLKFSNKKIFIGIIPIANSPKINLY